MTKPAPLDGQIIIAIRRISQAVETYSRYLWQEFELTAPQLGTLRELQTRGTGTPTQISDWMSISPATTAGILKRLHERKLIDRTRDPVDGRSIVVRISEQGIKLAAKAPSLLRDNFRQELDRLESWEQTQILSALQRVATMMNADEVEEVPFLYNQHAECEPSKLQSPRTKTGKRGRPALRKSDSSRKENR
jgi:DNA-binding MarR family transcriptional regulator